MINPQSLNSIFQQLLEAQKNHPLVQLFDLKNEAALSFLFDLTPLQDSFRFRALSRARRLAQELIDDRGEIKKERLREILSLLETQGFLFYPEGTNDRVILEHQLSILRRFSEESVLKSLRRFSKPLSHSYAERLALETLGIYQSGSPSEPQIRCAVLCAALTPLRQNVGSCFATAPAILIQEEQLEVFLDDLYQLLTTGKLKRTFGGVEYALPLSPSTGMGDLKKKLMMSPGLIAALEICGESPELVKKYAGVKSVEEFLRAVLLEKFSLKSSDLAQARRLEMTQLKQTIAAPDPKLEQIHRFFQKEKEARAAFKGICDNALLKAWEFTLASFSEVKMEFSRWNLYTSLGLDSKQSGGIAQLIYGKLDEKLKELNQKIEEYQKQYEIAFDQVKATELMLKNAASQSDARRLQAEYQSRAYHMRMCLEMRDQAYAQGSNYSNLFGFLIRQYDQKIPEYFQEIYDAEMQEIEGEFYDDSPAGFRLVYKHGRTDPSLWTLIDDAEGYIESLVAFFNATESSIAAACEWEGGDEEILEITSAIVRHVRSPEFLESALKRMTMPHQLPWAYPSGGTMTTLIKTYFCRTGELTHEEKWVSNESELAIFIIDTLKHLPPKVTEPFLKKEKKWMLMSSPTHAFLLLPGVKKVVEGWQEEIFTYTWVRDNVFIPCQRFYADMHLSEDESALLVDELSETLPVLLGHTLRQTSFPRGKLSLSQWRSHVLDAIGKPLADTVDAFLFQALPVVPGNQWKPLVRRILSDRMNDQVEKLLRLLPDVPAPYMTAKHLKDAAKGCFLLAEEKITLPFDLHQHVADHARFVGLAQPSPLLFADTNWTNYYFTFVVNPGTGRLELWRTDRTVSWGSPMTAWKPWLSGGERKTWTIYTRPSEYTFR